MSKTFQVTLPDEVYDEVKRLMDITRHERPGALFELLVMRYGQDLARCLSVYVPSAPDYVPPTAPRLVAPPPNDVPSTPDNVPSTPDCVPPVPAALSMKDKMRLLANPSSQ
jgi:hypothetical protein